MTRTLVLVLAAAALSTACGTGRHAHRDHSPAAAHSSAAAKQYVCHNGNTLDLPPSAVQAHLDHGDYRGSC